MMKKILTLLCAVMLLLTTACSTQNSAQGNRDPKDGLVVAIGGQITTLDPGLTQETVNDYVLRHLTAGLFHQDDDNNIVYGFRFVNDKFGNLIRQECGFQDFVELIKECINADSDLFWS